MLLLLKSIVFFLFYLKLIYFSISIWFVTNMAVFVSVCAKDKRFTLTDVMLTFFKYLTYNKASCTLEDRNIHDRLFEGNYLCLKIKGFILYMILYIFRNLYVNIFCFLSRCYIGCIQKVLCCEKKRGINY